MDPSYYFPTTSNPALMQKMSKINSNQPIQTLKPGFNYPENEVFAYNQSTTKPVEPQTEPYRNANVIGYQEPIVKFDAFKNTPKNVKNQRGNIAIIDVWKHNLEEEFNKIMDIIEDHTFIALDTEFPGIPYGCNSENEYLKIKENVDKLKVIQIGFSLAKEDALITNKYYTWQFNFKFDQYKDDCAPGSIGFLTNAGISFSKLESDGIDPQKFAEILFASGLILNEELKWISFHGGFDFGYLLKLLICTEMPPNIKSFYFKLKLYFPEFIDIKYIVKNVDELKTGGLSRLASELKVERLGEEHQAGSDALLTLAVYLKLKEKYSHLVLEVTNLNIIYMLDGDDEEGREYYQDYYYLNEYPNNFYNSYNLNNIGNIMTNFYQNQTDPYTMQGIYSNYNDVLYKGFQYQNDNNNNMNVQNAQNSQQKQKKFK